MSKPGGVSYEDDPSQVEAGLLDRRVDPEPSEVPLQRAAITLGVAASNEVIRDTAAYYAGHLFAAHPTDGVLSTITSIMANQPDSFAAELGVNRGGEEGLAQLREAVRLFRDTLFAECDLTDDQLIRVATNDLWLSALKDVTRYDDAEWEDGGDDALRQQLLYVAEARRRGSLQGLGAHYQASGECEVVTLAATKEKGEWTVDLMGRYQKLQAELTEVAERAGPRFRNQDVLVELLEELRAKVQELRNKYVTDIGRAECPERERLSKEDRIGIFDAMLMRTAGRTADTVMSTYEEEFAGLAMHKVLHPHLRKLAFAWTMRHKLPFQQMVRNLPADPDANAVTQMRRFVRDIVGTEVFGSFFNDPAHAHRFAHVVSTDALEIALLRKRGVGVARTTVPIQFIPTRGILMELSGYIGDTCFTAQGASLAERHPNITTILMKQHPNDVERRKFIGFCMLIETADNAGDPVLVMRALNPIENVINKLSAESFYATFVQYVKSIAARKGMRVGVTIDDRVGGSSTNRPLLFDFLAKKRDQTLRPIPVDRASSLFNGFDISNVVYEVE